jgi:hypothetical protein
MKPSQSFCITRLVSQVPGIGFDFSCLSSVQGFRIALRGLLRVPVPA